MGISRLLELKTSSKLTGLPWLDFLEWMNSGQDGNFNPTSNTSLTSNIYFFESVNIPSGVTVTPNGSFLCIVAKNEVRIDGLLSASGKGSSGGASVYAAQKDVAGVNGEPATGFFGGAGGGGGGNDNNSSKALPGKGGNGLAGPLITLPGGSASSNSPGGNGATHNFNYGSGDILDLPTILNSKGAGGGSGNAYSHASNHTSRSGEGGHGGGCIVIVANSIVGNGAIRADGLNGGNGVRNGYGIGAGGGGGGGGGLILLIAKTISIPTISASGGQGGNGSPLDTYGYNSGYNGGNGGNGLILLIKR